MSALNKYILALLCCLLSVEGLLSAQDIDKLKAQKEQLEKEIAFTRQQVTQMQQKRSLTLNELVTLKKQINTREAIIQNIRGQIRVYDNQIAESRAVITTLENDIAALKEEYAKMLYHTYVNHTQHHDLLFLFSSSTFNDAFQRLRYLKAYSDYRRQQALLIRQTMDGLAEEIAGIEAKKSTQETLLANAQEQQQVLSREKSDLSKKATQFKEKEAYYKRELQKNEEQANKLNQQIERMIAEAAAKARNTNKKAGGGYNLTPEAIALSNSFAANKGKLPWPVERGTIIRGFGKKPHPVLKGVYTNNNGVDIATEEAALVRAVYAGKVTNTFYHPTFNRGVIVSHGEYFTVYLNMKEVYVTEGESVATKDRIGKAFTAKEDGSTAVHLEIWKGTTLLNPAHWLYQ